MTFMTQAAHWLRSAGAALAGRMRARPLFYALLAAVLLPVLALAYVLALIPFTPSITDLRKAKAEQPSVLMSADGKELALFKRANRDWVKLGAVSPKVVAALIATEDHRFHEHGGLDFVRTGSAVLRTLGGDLQGGSTLTQQLARNLYPEQIGRSATLTRKIKEAITAVKIEAVFTKDEILETYLNTVPFLYNAYGIEMAARTYFDTAASDLDALQGATLVGMLKGTSYYNPVLNPERAVQRRNTVLAQMVKHGHLAQPRFEALKQMPLGLDFERQNEALGPAPHLAKQMRRWLIDWADRNGYNAFADGLVVRTTIDSRLQDLANQAVQRQADALQAVADVEWGQPSARLISTNPEAYAQQARKLQPFSHFWNANKELVQAFVRESPAYKTGREAGQSDGQALAALLADGKFMQALRADKTRLQAGFLALVPASGHVKAWVGSRDFATDQFDHVQQARRQPGSTFKPFVYGAAFEMGANPAEMLMDQAVELPMSDGTLWKPGDGTPPSGAPMSLRDGLVQSKNTITAQVMQKVGPHRVASLARAMGVRQSKLDEVPSLALGTSPVTLKEMVTAYGTLANGGNYLEPVIVTQVEDRHGAVLERFAPAPAQTALSPGAAQTLLSVMRGVVERGTGTGIRQRFGVQADVAGKTGTTQDNTDGWFILMHSQLVAGAWVGFNDNRVTMRSSYWGQGAHNALFIVGDFFQQTLKARLVDAKRPLATPRQAPASDAFGQFGAWVGGLFPRLPEPVPEPMVVAEPASSFSTPAPAPALGAMDLPRAEPFPRGGALPPEPLRSEPSVVAGPRRFDIVVPPAQEGRRTPEPMAPAPAHRLGSFGLTPGEAARSVERPEAQRLGNQSESAEVE